MTEFARFERACTEIARHTTQIARANNAEVFQSHPRSLTGSDAAERVYDFPSPTLLWNMPSRGSSRRTNNRAIFVNGAFVLRDDRLRKSYANMEIYSFTRNADRVRLSLVDAFHFDVETIPQTRFHPIFHVQRGRPHGLQWTDDVRARLVSTAARISSENVTIDTQHWQSGADCVRIPTPQMDYFTTLVSIVADSFGGVSDRREVMRAFTALARFVLQLQTTEFRLSQSSELHVRQTRWASESSAACVWYEEVKP